MGSEGDHPRSSFGPGLADTFGGFLDDRHTLWAEWAGCGVRWDVIAFNKNLVFALGEGLEDNPGTVELGVWHILNSTRETGVLYPRALSSPKR